MQRIYVDLVPDVVVLLQRDGKLLDIFAGHGVLAPDRARERTGSPIENMWPQIVCDSTKSLLRQAIADRSTVDGSFQHGNRYEVRVTPQGPDRAICVFRCTSPRQDEIEGGAHKVQPFDRRGTWQRMKSQLADFVLRETPAAMAIISVDGIAEIARNIDIRLSEEVMVQGIQRIEVAAGLDTVTPPYLLGQINDNALGVLIQSSDRDTIEACLARLCATLRAPIRIGHATFNLTPHVGVALLGTDGTTAKVLLDHARAAAQEARSSGSSSARFFSDTLRLRSLAKIDIGLELRHAIEARSIRLRYVGRHDLTTGRLMAHVGYVQWIHPVRGYVQPAEFLGVAEATGLARMLSQSILTGLEEDFEGPLKDDPHIRVSFGALRHHIHDRHFFADIKRVILGGSVAAERLELRIAERTLISQSLADYSSLRDLGIRLVVDEMGRGVTSLEKLARAGLWGLQLDRTWVVGLNRDPAALDVCRAAVGVAATLGLIPIAAGVDDAQHRQELLNIGCVQGIGDLYRLPFPNLLQSAALAGT